MVRQSKDLPNKLSDDRDRLTLVSDFEPAGDQPTAIAGLIEGLNDGLARQTLLGVAGSLPTTLLETVRLTVALLDTLDSSSMAALQNSRFTALWNWSYLRA